MGIESSIDFAIDIVSDWDADRLRDAALTILRAPNVRSTFESPQNVASGAVATQLKVHRLSVAETGASLLADDLIDSLERVERRVQYLVFASDQGNVGVFFEGDETPIGGWVLPKNA